MPDCPDRWEDPWTAIIYDHQTRGAEWLRGDVEFWRALVEVQGGPVLELGCGTGRVALALARAGWQVTALDLSPGMLGVLRRKLDGESPDVKSRVRLIHGDMRAFTFGQSFPLVIIPYHAFQFLLSRAEQRSCLQCVFDHLPPAGKLAMHVSNPRLPHLAAPCGVDDGIREYSGPHGARVREHGYRTYNIVEQTTTYRTTYECFGPDGSRTVHEQSADMRYLFRFEVEWMLEACGLEVEAMYGGADRSPLTAESWEIFVVARRRVVAPKAG